MLTLKQLFKDKEKIKNTQITFERHQKSDNSGEMFIGLYILNGLLVLGYYIFTGKFIDASPVIIFIFPTIMICIELMVYELYLKTKNKRKKTEESTKEEKLTKLFFDSQKEELQKFVKENYEYLEILSKAEAIDNKIFLSNFFYLIKNSTREELMANNENIRNYINNDFPYNYDDIKSKTLEIIEEKLKTKESKEPKKDTEIDEIFKKETKKIIKSI